MKTAQTIADCYETWFHEVDLLVVTEKELPPEVQELLVSTFGNVQMVLGSIPKEYEADKILIFSSENLVPEIGKNTVAAETIKHTHPNEAQRVYESGASVHVVHFSDKVAATLAQEFFTEKGAIDSLLIYDETSVDFSSHPDSETDGLFLSMVYAQNAGVKPRSPEYINDHAQNFYIWKGKDQTPMAGYEMIDYGAYQEIGAVFAINKLHGNGLGKQILSSALNETPDYNIPRFMITDNPGLMHSALEFGGQIVSSPQKGIRELSVYEDITSVRGSIDPQKFLIVF